MTTKEFFLVLFIAAIVGFNISAYSYWVSNPELTHMQVFMYMFGAD